MWASGNSGVWPRRSVFPKTQPIETPAEIARGDRADVSSSPLNGSRFDPDGYRIE